MNEVSEIETEGTIGYELFPGDEILYNEKVYLVSNLEINNKECRVTVFSDSEMGEKFLEFVEPTEFEWDRVTSS